jgi:glutaredoxin-related protein
MMTAAMRALSRRHNMDSHRFVEAEILVWLAGLSGLPSCGHSESLRLVVRVLCVTVSHIRWFSVEQ